MKSRKYPSHEIATEELSKKGTLTYQGREGRNAEKGVYTLELWDGRRYVLFIHMRGEDAGLVEIVK